MIFGRSLFIAQLCIAQTNKQKGHYLVVHCIELAEFNLPVRNTPYIGTNTNALKLSILFHFWFLTSQYLFEVM